MNSNKKTARIVGILFLTAMVTSLLGGGLLESILTAPDYLVNVSANTTLVSIGMSLELMNGIAVVGIAVMLFPILKQHDESIALGYVGFRVIESVFCVVSAIIPLSLITLSQEYLKAGASDASSFQTLGTLLTAARAHLAGLFIPVFFSLGALLFYYVLYRSNLIPRFISVWGFIGVALMLTVNFSEVGMGVGMILALPIILNEIFLGIWLIVYWSSACWTRRNHQMRASRSSFEPESPKQRFSSVYCLVDQYRNFIDWVEFDHSRVSQA